MIRFILNQQTIKTELPPGSTVLDFVRYHKRLTGTKIGCREGDCGACTVLVGDFENGRLVYRSMTSCLMPLSNAQGKHIVTVEGINGAQLTPVQQAMVDTNGAQCGFCTLGFVMSFTGFALHEGPHSYEKSIAAIDGNICRCTGYKSIERAARKISEHLSHDPAGDRMAWLTAEGFVPEYFTGIADRLEELQKSIAATEVPAETDGGFHLGGGTDLLVQKPETVRHAPVRSLAGLAELQQIDWKEGQIHVGASVTVTQFAENEHVRSAFPHLDKIVKLISSTPIRNMATLAGNLVNASPIGDMSVFFLALDSMLTIRNAAGEKRQVALKNFFTAYKQKDLQPGEIIETITFAPPAQDTFFNFEKVCKRTHLDIASVNTAFLMRLQEDGTIAEAHLSAGGVWPFPKYLERTAAFLTGKKTTQEVWKEADVILQSEVAPISDARGSEAYKRLLLSRLFLAHYVEWASR